MVTYVGNGPYCYANTTSMLLASIGETVSPSVIEVLSGVGLGASWNPQTRSALFGTVAPDVGVSKALDLLGFGYEERSCPDGEPLPLDDLRRALETGPVALGPVDMGCLSYKPRAHGPNGSDHFVLAYAADDAEVHLHDPAGFPHVSLPFDHLEQAWRAEKIGYRRGGFRHWFAPKRHECSSDDDLFERALAWFGTIYETADARASERGWLAGAEAIRPLAVEVRAGRVTPDRVGHITAFHSQRGAKLALDYAAFFDARRADLAALKRRQAESFGRAHTLAVREEWVSLADTLENIASLEDDLADALQSRTSAL
jgi:hypothetical protein